MSNEKNSKAKIFGDDVEIQAQFSAAFAKGYKPYLYLTGYQELIYMIEGFYRHNLPDENYVYLSGKKKRLYDNNLSDNLFEMLISRLPENAKNAILCPTRDDFSLGIDKYLRTKVLCSVASLLKMSDTDIERAQLRYNRFWDEVSEFLDIEIKRGH